MRRDNSHKVAVRVEDAVLKEKAALKIGLKTREDIQRKGCYKKHLPEHHRGITLSQLERELNCADMSGLDRATAGHNTALLDKRKQLIFLEPFEVIGDVTVRAGIPKPAILAAFVIGVIGVLGD